MHAFVVGVSQETTVLAVVAAQANNPVVFKVHVAPNALQHGAHFWLKGHYLHTILARHQYAEVALALGKITSARVRRYYGIFLIVYRASIFHKSIVNNELVFDKALLSLRYIYVGVPMLIVPRLSL